MGNFIAGSWNVTIGILSLLFSLVWMAVQLGVALAIPAANYFIWKSNLKSNLKLMYVTIFSLLALTVITVIQLTSKPAARGFHSIFDPELAFYQTQNLKKDKQISREFISEMGLDTCVDPDGNIIDLAKRFKLDHSWVLFETPNEYLRKDTIEALVSRGDFTFHKLSAPLAPSDSKKRHNQIKLEDFRFLDTYLRKEKLSQAKETQGSGIIYFDLDGLNEDAFESFTQTAIDYQKDNSDNPWNVLFSTSDNYLSNHLSSR